MAGGAASKRKAAVDASADGRGDATADADGGAGAGSEDEMEQQLRDHAVLAYNEFVRAFQRRASERIAANRVAIDLQLQRRARDRLSYPMRWRSAHIDAWQNVARAHTSEMTTAPDRIRKTARTDVRLPFEHASITRHAVVMPRVPPRPGGMMWTGIIKNYDVEDQPELQHKPYFGDDDDDDVVSEYYQLHRLHGTSTCEVDFIKELCDAVLRQLMETWELSTCDLKVVARTIQVEPNVVIEVHKLIKRSLENAEAKKRMAKRSSETAATVATGGAAPAPTPVVDYEAAVDTFRKFFCRRCYVYDCDYHPYDPDDVPKLSIGESNAVHEAIKSKGSGMARNCGNDCFLGQTQSSARLSKSRLVTSAFGWDAGERALCARAYMLCGGSFCDMAKLLGAGKTCMDVAEFCEFNDINDHALALEQRKARPFARRSSKKAKKNKYRPSIAHLTQIESKERDIIPTTITPCAHVGPCDDAHCSCHDNGWLCTKLCACVHENCKIFFSGCRCHGRCRTKACPCFASGRECDPDLCRVCCADQHALLPTFGEPNASSTDPQSDTACQNRNLRLRRHKHVRVGRSTNPGAGWGLFVDEPVAKDEFIIEYIGEMVTQLEAERRGVVYDKLNRSYLFNLDTNTVIDATRKGNKTRFMNHSSDKPNCYPKIMNVNSDYRIGLYAARDIEPHTELFFNYGYEKDMEHKDLHKTPTILEWMK